MGQKGELMRKRNLVFLILILFLTQSGTAEITSLSDIFHLGKGIRDLDKDNLGDKVVLNIILPDTPNAYEIAAAGDIAARANLESLVVDFSLVKKESEVKDILNLENPLLIGANLKWIKKMKKAGRIDLPPLEHSQGLVSLFSYKDKHFVILTSGSEKVLRIPSPSLGAEDFASFSERVPAAYVRIGCYDEKGGYVHGLHTPYFNFDENLLTDGTRVLSFLLVEFLSSGLGF